MTALSETSISSQVNGMNMTANLLNGRRVLVVGALGAIGSGVCAAMSAAGAVVVRADLRDGRAEQRTLDAEYSGERHDGDHTIAMDATDEASVASAFTAAGHITDVVNTVGKLSVGPIAKTSLAEFSDALGANLTAAFLIGREASRCLEPGGTLTFVASQAGYRAGANWGVYCAGKAGVLRLSEALAQELGPRGVRVNAVCPGSVETPMLEEVCARLARLEGGTAQDVMTRYLRTIPMGRLATPREVGDVCVFLASPLAAYVSGSALPVDGGEISA